MYDRLRYQPLFRLPVLALAALLPLAACQGGDAPAAPGPKGSIAARSAGADTLALRLVSDDGATDTVFASASALTPDLLWPTGRYTLTATAGEPGADGWEMPYYEGSAAFEVLPDQTAAVEVVATQQKAVVTVTATDAFRAYMTSYTVRVAASGASWVWESGESRSLYLRPALVSVDVDYVGPTGRQGVFRAAEFAAAAGTRYDVKVDAYAGVALVTLSLDDEMSQQSVEIEI